MKTSFSVIEAVIIFSRTDGSQLEVDICNNLVEFKTFEHISKSYIDANITFLDDFGMKDTLSVQGTERIKITVGDPEDDSNIVFEKYFFFLKITDLEKLNEKSELISIDLVEEHIYVNAVKNISKSFTAPIEDIISSIAQNELGKTVKKADLEGSAQGTRKVLIPYLSPLEAINWVLTRATTKTGSPLYLRPSLFTDDLILSDLDALLKKAPFNEKLPLRYSESIRSVSDQAVDLADYYEIATFREQQQNNMMQLYEEGCIGSLYSNLDVGTGISSSSHVSVRDIVSEFYLNDMISKDASQSMYDPSLLIGGKLSDEYDSLSVFQVTSSNTYNQFLSIHDEATLLDKNGNFLESKLKVNKIIRMMLKKNALDIGVSGTFLFEAGAMVGEKLRVIFLNSNTESSDKDIFEQIDKVKSGDYIIIAINHILNDQHNTILRISKLAELPKDFSL